MELPVPKRTTLRVTGGKSIVKVAVTVLFWFMVTVQMLPLLLSQSDQLVNVAPGNEDAVRVTGVPLA